MLLKIIMKTVYKLIISCILIFIVSTICLTYWYISDHLISNVSDVQTKSVKDIIIEIGVIGAIIPTLLFINIYILKIKVKRVWLFSFLTSILIAFGIITSYRFILYMIFLEFNTPFNLNKNIASLTF